MEAPSPPPAAERPISTREWILALAIGSLPVVNFVMWIVWLVDATTPPTKRNYALASLIVAAVTSVLLLLLLTVAGLAVWLAMPEHVNRLL